MTQLPPYVVNFRLTKVTKPRMPYRAAQIISHTVNLFFEERLCKRIKSQIERIADSESFDLLFRQRIELSSRLCDIDCSEFLHWPAHLQAEASKRFCKPFREPDPPKSLFQMPTCARQVYLVTWLMAIKPVRFWSAAQHSGLAIIKMLTHATFDILDQRHAVVSDSRVVRMIYVLPCKEVFRPKSIVWLP